MTKTARKTTKASQPLSIRERPGPRGTSYQVRWREADGLQLARSFPTREAAEGFAADTNAKLVNGRTQQHQAMTVAELADRWLAWKGLTSKTRAHVLARYRSQLDAYVIPTLGTMRLDRLDRPMLNDWVVRLSKHRTRTGHGLDPKTIRRIAVPVKQMLAYAVNELQAALPNGNPANDLSLPVENKAPKQGEQFAARPLAAKEQHALLGALADRDPTGIDALAVALLLGAGLRAAELAGLEVRDVNLLGKTIRVERTKTKVYGEGAHLRTDIPKSKRSKRTVPLPPWLAARLSSFLDTHPHRTDPKAPLLPARTRSGLDWSLPIETGTFLQRRFRPALAAAGLPETVRLHDCRHTYGTDLVNAGVRTEVVSRLMGHASIAITDSIYVHVNAADHGDAVSVLPDPFAASSARSAKPPARTRTAKRRTS